MVQTAIFDYDALDSCIKKKKSMLGCCYVVARVIRMIARWLPSQKSHHQMSVIFVPKYGSFM